MGWTYKEIPPLKGKTCIVTGANSGLGYQATRHLARSGATVVMACRNAAKAEKSKADIMSENPAADLSIRLVDLADLSSIRNFVKSFRESSDQVDILINNAGIGGFPMSKTKDGHESHFGINHLGHFLLTGLLLDTIKNSAGARVINVSSVMNRIGSHDFSDINYENRRYNKWHAYGRSKLANVLFSNELNRKFSEHGIDALSATAHPGYSSTSFQGKGPEAYNSKIDALTMKFSNAVFAQTDEMGAMPTLYAATSNEISGGDYVGPNFLRVRGYPVKQRARRAAYDKNLSARLWTISEEMTDCIYSF